MKTQNYTFSTDDCFWEVVETKSGKRHYITGYISTKDVDLYNELVTENAMKQMLQSLKSKIIKLDVDHEVFRGNPNAIPVGKIVEAEYDGYGVKVKAELNSASPAFKDVWGSIKNGFIDAFSIAYKTLDSVTKTIEGKTVKLLNSIDLLNVALTGNPVNSSCKMTSVFTKSLEDLNQIQEENKMTEEKQDVSEIQEEAVEEDTVVVEEEVIVVDEEVVAEEEKPLEEKIEVEEKAILKKQEEDLVSTETFNTELKSRDEKIVELEKTIAELKAFVEKPQLKSKVEETPKVEVEKKEFDIKSPIQLIR